METHIAALFNKLNVRSRTELVASVLRPAEGQSVAARSSAAKPKLHNSPTRCETLGS